MSRNDRFKQGLMKYLFILANYVQSIYLTPFHFLTLFIHIHEYSTKYLLLIVYDKQITRDV